MNSSGILQSHHPALNINNFTLSNTHYGANWSNAAHPGPYPTSSYPRGGIYHNFYCYIVSLNTNPSYIYLKNTATGAFYRFPMPYTLNSSYGDFVMSVDHINDEWYIYGVTSSSQIIQFKGPWSWTEMRLTNGDAAVSINTRKDDGAWASITSFSSLPMASDMQGTQLGYTSKGGVRYKTNGNQMVTLNTNGQEVFRYSSDPMFGNSSNSTGNLWRHFGHPVLATNAAGAGLSDADIKLTITGIEQT